MAENENVVLLPGMFEIGSDVPDGGELSCPRCGPRPVKFALSLPRRGLALFVGWLYRGRGLILEPGSVKIRCLGCGREFAIEDAIHDFPEAAKLWSDLAE